MCVVGCQPKLVLIGNAMVQNIFKNCTFGITFISSSTFLPHNLGIDITFESSQQSFKAMYDESN